MLLEPIRLRLEVADAFHEDMLFLLFAVFSKAFIDLVIDRARSRRQALLRATSQHCRCLSSTEGRVSVIGVDTEGALVIRRIVLFEERGLLVRQIWLLLWCNRVSCQNIAESVAPIH